jgi:ribosome biogenesis ATPase
MTETRLGIMQKPEPAQAITETGDKEEKDEEAPAIVFEIPKERYTNVIGMRRAKALFHKYVEAPLKNKESYEELKIKKSIGILLYGPPGNGKTFLAKAVFGELQIPMCYVEGNKIKSKYVGESGKNVGILFKIAREEQPAGIFIDEADNLLVDRDKISQEGGGLEHKDVITQFLTEISKIHDDPASHICILAATNRPWDVDKAQKRSGRFSYTIYIGPPNFWDRIKIFKLYLTDVNNPKRLGSINYALLALGTIRYSPVDIWRLCDAAKRNVAEKPGARITTRTIQKILWNNDTGKSTLDPWYSGMAQDYLTRKKNIFKAIIFKSYREKKNPEPKFGDAEKEEYKEMITDVSSYARYKWPRKIARTFAKGLPNYW